VFHPGRGGRVLRRSNDRPDAAAVTGLRTPDCVKNNQYHYRPNDGYEQTIEVQSRDARGAETIEEPTADHCTDDSENDVQKEALAPSVYEFASDETGQQPQYNPS
jgi:hypothetical protein